MPSNSGLGIPSQLLVFRPRFLVLRPNSNCIPVLTLGVPSELLVSRPHSWYPKKDQVYYSTPVNHTAIYTVLKMRLISTYNPNYTFVQFWAGKAAIGSECIFSLQ